MLLSACLFALMVSNALPAQERSVIDDAEREVRLPEGAQRVVTTSPANTQLVLALGVAEKVVGVTSVVQYLSYAPDIQSAAEEKEKVGDATGLNYERIVALSPDLVVLDGDQQQALTRLSELAPQAGFRIYVNSPEDIDGIMENLEELGRLLGATNEADRIVREMTRERDRVRELVSGIDERLSMAYIIYGPDPLWTAGGGTFMGRAFRGAGLENVFSDIEGYTQVSREQVVERNPDVLLLSADVPIQVEEVPSMFGESLAAVQSDRVYRLSRELGSMLEQRQTEVTRGMLELYELVYGSAR